MKRRYARRRSVPRHTPAYQQRIQVTDDALRPKRGGMAWHAVREGLQALNSVLIVILTVAGVYIAYQANEIANAQNDLARLQNDIAVTQHRATLMESTILQAQSTPLLSFETSPTLLGQLLLAAESESFETTGTRDIVVSNYGYPAVNLVCEPLTIMEVTVADDTHVNGQAVALIPIQDFYFPGTLDRDRTSGVGELYTIRGIEGNIRRLYELQDGFDDMSAGAETTATARMVTFVRTEFTNILGEQENRLYRVGHYGVFRVDPNFVGDILVAVQDRARHREIVSLSDVTPDELMDTAVQVVQRTGGDDPLPYYEPLLVPPYLDPDFNLESWAITFYQEPYWGFD